MSNTIYAVIFLLLSLGGVVVRKTYFRLPTRELKRRAERHDATARSLYRAVAYGNSLRGLLWLYIGLTAAAGLILLARDLNIWISLLVVGPLLWIAFSLVPASRTTRFGTGLALMVTPPIAWLLDFLHPLLSRGADLVRRRYTAADHTNLYERDDLIHLLEKQRHQEDSRFTEEELEIAIRALGFDEHLVADVMTPRKKIKTVLAKDTLGPILIDELHKNGQEQVLVRDTPKGQFVGSLRFSQLGINSHGQVRDVMQPTVYYVHQNDTLGEALHAFFVTNHPVFVVVDNEEEYVGVISVQDILKRLVGHLPGDDFDQYSDPAAVAARHPAVRRSSVATTEPDKPGKPDTPVKTDEEVVE